MKVLALSPSIDDCGGVQRYTLALVQALDDLLGTDKVRLLAVEKGQLPSQRLSLKIKTRFTLQAVCRANAGRGGEQEVGDSLSQEEDRYVGRKESLGHFPCL